MSLSKNELKILVFTVPSWNSKVGANSWETLLKDYPSKNIANIYIRDEVPDSSCCDKYFYISERKVISSILNRRLVTGKIIEKEFSSSNDDEISFHNTIYNSIGKKRNWFLLLIRELLWFCGKWKTTELNLFLDDFNPDIILHSMDGYIHLNRIIEYSIKRTKARGIGYIWDDNFTYKQSNKFGYKIYRFFQRKSLHKLAKLTDSFFAITGKTKKEADYEFNINSILLTKPLNSCEYVSKKDYRKPISILYTGNLLYGRYNSLLLFVEQLKRFSKNEFVLDVYTQTILSEQELNKIQCDFCRIHKPIPQNEVLELQKKSDVLLFLEGVTGDEAKVARLSFSTKITDYLSSSRTIFAIGNTDTAPIEYFIENDAAIVASTSNEIYIGLKKIIDNPDVLVEYSYKGYLSGINNHNPEKIKSKFDSILCKELL